jgi:hypothetical protein
MTRAVARKTEDWGRHGPAMMALPNDQWRAFAEAYATKRPGHGALTAAARETGFGTGSTTPTIMAKIAWRLSSDDRMIAAIAELSRKIIRVGSTEAANAVLALLRDPAHRDHARAIEMVISRSDPIETRHRMEVIHKTVDPDDEAIEELKALRSLGTPRTKLLELFGGNGLERLEDLESSRAKVIDHEPSFARLPKSYGGQAEASAFAKATADRPEGRPVGTPPIRQSPAATTLAPVSKRRTTDRPTKREPAVPDELLDQGDDF